MHRESLSDVRDACGRITVGPAAACTIRWPRSSISASEASQVVPRRVDVVTAARADSVQTLAQRMAYDDAQEARQGRLPRPQVDGPLYRFSLFSLLAAVSKGLHNFLGILFMLSLAFFTFRRLTL